MRILQRALPALSLALLCGHLAWAQNSQNNETFSAGAGGAYDPSVCNDPGIAETAASLKSTAYHDPTPAGNGVLSPLRAALNVLALKEMNGQINNASVCLGAPGVIYFVPTNLVGQVTQLVEQEEAAQPGGDTYSGGDNNGSTGQPGGTPTTGGGTTPSATSLNPCEPDYDMSTPAGRAAAVQNAPETQYECCEYRRAHNPDLAPCTPVLIAQVPQTTPNLPATQPCKQQTGTATADDLVTALYKFYRSQQFTKWGAAYMIGSLIQESSLNPALQQYGGLPGYGLGQWTNQAPFTSYTALQCYAQAHGTPISDFVMQAHFSVQQRPDITNLFKTAQNAQQAQNAVTQYENFGIQGTNRFAWGAAICQNVVCTQAPPSPFYDDPKVGVPAGKGLGVNVSKALGSGADLSKLIQNLQCPWTEPANLATFMDTCMKKASPKKQ